MKNPFRVLSLLVVVAFLAGCASSPQRHGNLPQNAPESWEGDGMLGGLAGSSRSSSARKFDHSVVPEPSGRPGLGTSWGEDRESNVDYTTFSRGSRSRPNSTGKIFYNDEAGAKAMASASGFRWQSGGPTREGPVSIGLKSASGRYLKSYSAGGDRFYVGDHGDRYKIYIKNHVANRVEVVVSVDGLDVLDGKRASPSKRGYIIRGNGTLTIDGFRQSENTVAAFRFGSVSESYAERKHGDSRNVGVIGVAIYTEYGRDPWRQHSHDNTVRKSADPFPSSGRFATPPR